MFNKTYYNSVPSKLPTRLQTEKKILTPFYRITDYTFFKWKALGMPIRSVLGEEYLYKIPEGSYERL